MKFKEVVKDIWQRNLQIVDMSAAIVAKRVLVRADRKLEKLSKEFVNVRCESKSKKKNIEESSIFEMTEC